MSDAPIRQPKQRYERQPDDPKWLVDAVRLHGHLGPWAAAGLRVGQAALSDLDCDGYFDIRIDVSGPIAKPPPRCIVDGLQFATGATLGKDSIHIELAESFEIRATNTTTGQSVRYRLTDGFLEAVSKMSGHAEVEALARRVAREPFDRLAARHE
ncbi:MAG: formylmethanofuran dehydrogenase subunit E family protein [Phycisphaerae bacterium]|nr:formylmethanofuran dehydrogenase subunit E family protein [Phycisphaerae bacterium]